MVCSPRFHRRSAIVPRWPAWTAARLVAAGLTLLAGCHDAAPPAKEAKSEPAASAAPGVDESPAAAVGQETWDVYFIQGDRVGYGRSAEQEVVDEGRTLLRIEAESQLFIKRFGQATDFGYRVSSLETPEGQLLSLISETGMGPQPAVVTGIVEGGKLQLQTAVAGKATTSQINWPSEARGYFAIDQELKRQPMQPGERRTLQALQPVFNTLAEVELVAADYEATDLLTGSYELLRIECTLRQPSGNVEQTLWANRTGAILKTHMSAMEMTSYRTTKAVALEKSEATFDLGKTSTVKLPKPLQNPHQTRKVRYRVELAGEDPAGVFVSGPTQQVKSIGPNEAEITVETIGADSPLPVGETVQPSPPDDDREPNEIVQSDDPRIVAMAKQAAGAEDDPWKVALALETYVHRKVKQKNYSTAFATASEVAETMSGDCTEHTVLLAALARARGIPSRAALGLVYAPSQQGFAYHMWNEVYVNGRWIPLDATLGAGGIGAAHLKLADSSLKGASAYSSFLPVAKVIGKLKIEVLEEVAR